MSVYLRAKLQVSSITLTSFRQGVILHSLPTTSKRAPKKPTQIRVGLCLFKVKVLIKTNKSETFDLRNISC